MFTQHVVATSSPPPVRVRLHFQPAVIPPRWLIVPPTHKLVSDLIYYVSKRFRTSKRKEFGSEVCLHIDGLLVPPNELISVVRDGDARQELPRVP